MERTESREGKFEYYRKTFVELFEEFTRKVFLDQVDHYMHMVEFRRVDDEPVLQEPDENLGENNGASILVWSYRNDRQIEFDFRLAFHPLLGLEFNIDFEAAGSLIYSGPYVGVDEDRWDCILDSIEDGVDEVAKQRERKRFKVVK